MQTRNCWWQVLSQSLQREYTFNKQACMIIINSNHFTIIYNYCYIAWVQVANVDSVSSGDPRVRTMVFRGFIPLKWMIKTASETSSFANSNEIRPVYSVGVEDSGEQMMVFTTDIRSEKFKSAVMDHANLPHLPTEICWMMTSAESGEWKQFRLRGKLFLISSQELDRVNEPIRSLYAYVYRQLTPNIIQSFHRLQAPGSRIEDNEKPLQTDYNKGSNRDIISENYALCLMRCSRVEMLDLPKSERYEWLSNTTTDLESGYWSGPTALYP